MNILLTTKQTAMLEELFDFAEFNAERGKPGIIAGQFFRSSEGDGYFVANYMTNEQAEIMLKSLGFPVVDAPEEMEVYTGIE